MAQQYIYTMQGLKKIVPPGKEILKGIWLSFFPGAKIGVLGLNGSGKSSLLRIMAGEDTDIEGEARRIVAAFESAGLLLFENCQWPYSLSAYEGLFPGSLDRPPKRFWMSLQPASTGLQA